jgi:hypothetical protein
MIFCTKYPKHYGNAVGMLDQNRQLGLTGYPKTVAEAYTLLSQWAHEPVVYRPVMCQDTVFSSDMRYYNGHKQDKERKVHDLECYYCGKKGLMAKECWAPGGGYEGQKPKSRNNGGGKEGQNITKKPIRRKRLLMKKSNARMWCLRRIWIVTMNFFATILMSVIMMN